MGSSWCPESPGLVSWNWDRERHKEEVSSWCPESPGLVSWNWDRERHKEEVSSWCLESPELVSWNWDRERHKEEANRNRRCEVRGQWMLECIARVPNSPAARTVQNRLHRRLQWLPAARYPNAHSLAYWRDVGHYLMLTGTAVSPMYLADGG